MTRDEIFVLALISPIVVIFGCGIAALVELILKVI